MSLSLPDEYDGSDPRRCNAKTRSVEQKDNATRQPGTPCRNWAGARTPHKGVGPCWLHSGRTQSHKTHAVVTEAKKRMVTMGQPIEDVTAPGALMSLLRASAGHVSWLQSEVAVLTDLASHEAEVLVKLYDSERDRLARVGEACVRAGVAEHMVRMEQHRADLTLRAIRDAATDIGLNSRQLQALGIALRKRLVERGDDPELAAREAAQADVRLAEIREQLKAEEDRKVAKIADRRAQELSGLTFPPEELVPEDPPAA